MYPHTESSIESASVGSELMQLEASIRVVEQRGHLRFPGLLPWWWFWGPNWRLDVFFGCFFLGGAKNEDGCFCFFVSEGGEFFGEQ